MPRSSQRHLLCYSLFCLEVFLSCQDLHKGIFFVIPYFVWKCFFYAKIFTKASSVLFPILFGSVSFMPRSSQRHLLCYSLFCLEVFLLCQDLHKGIFCVIPYFVWKCFFYAKIFTKASSVLFPILFGSAPFMQDIDKGIFCVTLYFVWKCSFYARY